MIDDGEIGIPIDRETFHSLVGYYLDQMGSGGELSADDLVTMTRLWNTLSSSDLEETDEAYGDFAAAFFPNYVRLASETLGALPSKGMALYSKSYDLFIGGSPHANSQYRLT